MVTVLEVRIDPVAPLPICTVPALIVVVPVKLSDPERIRVPVPDWVRVPAPEMIPLRVWLAVLLKTRAPAFEMAPA